MNESDYTKVSNRVKISMALSIMRDVLPGEGYGISGAERADISKRLRAIEERLFGRIETREDEPSGYRLERGKALLIRGGPGSGKSTLARKIAEEHGTHNAISLGDLKNTFGLGCALQHAPEVLIVGGFPCTEENARYIRPLVAEEELTVHLLGKDPRWIKTPLLILCANGEEFSPAFDSDAFRIIDL